jgi:hypothetical protein
MVKEEHSDSYSGWSPSGGSLALACLKTCRIVSDKTFFEKFMNMEKVTGARRNLHWDHDILG